MSLRKPVASALMQAGMAGIQGSSASVASNPWVALVLSQQAALDGRFDASLKLSVAAVQVQGSSSAHRQVALACALAGLFHRGLLMACPLTRDGLGLAAHARCRPIYREAFQPMFALQRELRGSKSHLPTRVQAQVDRIHMVLDTLAGSEPTDGSRLQLLSDLIDRKDTSQTGQALLCSGVAYVLRDDGARAAQCFDELASLSRRLAWGFGCWVALSEMCMLDVVSRGSMPPSSTEISALIGPDFSSWLLEPNAIAGGAQERGSCARVEKAKAFIRESLGQRFSVADVAAHCEVSAKTLGQDFKEREGVTPLEYITRQRVMLAEQLLTQRQLTLKAVAQAVGFDSVLGFSKAYARITGHPPGAGGEWSKEKRPK
jgi:AraC-like DNA-binding protein